MPTIPTHAVAALTVLNGLPGRGVPRSVLYAGIACAVLPDADVVGFGLGIRYGDLLGHRGLTHSLFFAALMAAPATTFVLTRGEWKSSSVLLWGYLFLCAASHGVLDAATDGGLGVAFVSPFSNARFFWPWRPIAVSPIGLEIPGRVLLTELRWIWLPCAAAILVAYGWRRVVGAGSDD